MKRRTSIDGLRDWAIDRAFDRVKADMPPPGPPIFPRDMPHEDVGEIIGAHVLGMRAVQQWQSDWGEPPEVQPLDPEILEIAVDILTGRTPLKLNRPRHRPRSEKAVERLDEMWNAAFELMHRDGVYEWRAVLDALAQRFDLEPGYIKREFERLFKDSPDLLMALYWDVCLVDSHD